MNEEQILDRILRRMDILIALQLEKPIEGKSTPVSVRIKRLHQLGLKASEIADLIGKSTNYVTATLSTGKKGRDK